ncbi:hypothetical protein [Streptomyces sp. Isolate_219]|uniref:hypothetical protein n=1 Tax=Streptomyces sp. Isolate_219 TaxID=2950110 RepID=UPI0021C7DE45|nr:hypothetical protein [Streptomyces sp. Isolate_219]MCR8579360.1 hypothetical protein [Streptomyces sp. Isolate_219]
MRTAVVCALLCAATLPGPSAAAYAPKAPPAVSVTVTVTDGADDAESGKRLDYRITVHNLGATEVHGARIEQRMPATTTSATAPGGTVEGHGVGEQKAIWRSDLPAHDIQVFTATAVLGGRSDLAAASAGPAAPGTLRAAATVCVYVGESFAPTACSGDLDDLPETSPEGEGGGWMGWAAAAVAMALLGPGVVRAVRRRRAARAG